MATMADVAREAGVSITTVSHVINHTRSVNAETMRRVHDAIERTSYRPNSIARALAGARTRSLGLALSGISNPYLGDLIESIEAEAAKRGYTLLLGDTHDEPQTELQMVQELARRRVDGLLLAPSPGAQEGALRYLQAQSVPVVLIDRFLPTVTFDQVGPENVEPTALLVEHLAGLGHRRIGLIAGLQGLSTTTERIEGYRLGLRRSGISYDEALVAHGGSRHEPAREAVHRLFDSAAPTALVAGNNAMTIGAVHALRERGLSIPDDIALVAFDDFPWSDFFHPRLTAIAQPTKRIGEEAVQLMLSRLDDPTSPARRSRLEPKFVHRDSCGC